MSQRGRKRSQREDSEEEDGVELEHIQKKKTVRRRKKTDADDEEGDHKATRWESLSREQREKLVGDVMRLALFLDHKKHPLKRADVTAKVLPGHKGSQLTSHLIAEAQKKFKYIFGYELAEVPRVKADASDTGKGGTGVYILKNVYPKEAKQVLSSVITNQGLANQTALLHTILAMITLSDGVLESELLFTSLKKLGLDEDHPDPVLGDWKKLIDYFVKEMYIHRQKITGRVSASGAVISEYRWGGRALLEVDKIEIMRHVAAMFGEPLDSLIVQEMEKAMQQRMQKAANSAAEGSSEASGSQTSAAAPKRPAAARGKARREAD